jgi:hypothetical protein
MQVVTCICLESACGGGARFGGVGADVQRVRTLRATGRVTNTVRRQLVEVRATELDPT